MLKLVIKRARQRGLSLAAAGLEFPWNFAGSALRPGAPGYHGLFSPGLGSVGNLRGRVGTGGRGDGGGRDRRSVASRGSPWGTAGCSGVAWVVGPWAVLWGLFFFFNQGLFIEIF